ncbi:hypothetical protein ZWY2020_048495 [Hordeum vulgare]|nr:hypothetical protein ZWY2020_048495 [Hordeum vulgare]
MKMGRRNDKGKMLVGRAIARALVWLMLPVLVFLVLNSDYMPQVPLQATTLYLVAHAPPSSASSQKTAVHGTPSSTSSKQTLGEAVHGTPSPATSKQTPGEAPPSPATSDQTPVMAVDAPPYPVASRDETPGDIVGANKSQGELTRQGDTDVAAPRSKSMCDFSSERTDICAMQGDVRMHGKSATVYVVSASDDSYRPENGTVKIRPYPRKCATVHGDARRPAVVFSTGAYLDNFFHAMTDGIILSSTLCGSTKAASSLWSPTTTVSGLKVPRHPWRFPFTRHRFRCRRQGALLPSVQVGTEAIRRWGSSCSLPQGLHDDGLPELPPPAYSLKREWSVLEPDLRRSRMRRRPVSCQRSAEVVLGPRRLERHGPVRRGRELVCDGGCAWGGSPTLCSSRNATLVQIVPWGDMSWGSNAAFGAPSADMGLRYVQYETTAEETTLKYKYPKEHAIFTDLFLNGQNITLDIDRYKGVLQKIYQDSILVDPSFDSDPVVEASPASHASSGETPGDANRDLQNEKGFQAINAGVDASLIKSDVAAPRSKSICDFSSERTDICAMQGDVRMHGKSATVYVVSASDDSYRPENGTVKIRPYPRKSEEGTMHSVREVTIRWSGPEDAPRCTVTHDVPAVVFSTGAYLDNFFHAMTDGIIPLFNTVREYEGRVQLVVTDYNRKWVDKFQGILGALSMYPVIDFDADDTVRCFPSVHVGTEGHKEMGIIPALSRKGYTMTDFRAFLRSVYSLKREWSVPVNRTSGDRPRLLMVLRRNSRAFANEAAAVSAATEVGFEVVLGAPEALSDMARFAEVVNSCDVMVGVHGAGLTNLVFLPRNATLVQIVPWGGMSWGSNAAFGAPSADMGLWYVQYETTAEETTLKYKYPKEHAIFTDVASIKRQGYHVTGALPQRPKHHPRHRPLQRGVAENLPG